MIASLSDFALSSPTVVDDWRVHIDACNGKAARQLDVRGASMTRQGGKQKRGGVRLRGERTAVGFRTCSGAPSPGNRKTHEGDRSWALLVARPSPPAQTFFEYVFFPIGP